MQDFQSLLVQNRLLTEEVKRRIDQLAAINTVAATVSQSLDLDQTLKTALRAVLDVVSAEAGGISLIDEAAGEVVLRAQQGWLHDFVTAAPMRIPLGKGMSGKVIEQNDVVVDNNLDGTEELAVPRFLEEKFRSIAMAPMHARGKIVGILSIMSNKTDAFDNEMVTVLKAIADTVGVALDNARLYETTAEQEKRLNAVFHSSADGMIATDQNGRLNLINHAAEIIFDVDARKLIGTPLREAPIHPRVRESLLYALSARTEGHDSFQVTLESGRMLSLHISPVYIESQVDQSREKDGWIVVVQDITHLREAELQRAEFIRAAAHDMRNPLGVALSSLNLLENFFAEEDSTANEIIGIATSGILRLQDLINDLLNLEQLENGYDVNMAEVDVTELIREACNEIKPLLIEKSLECKVDAPDKLLAQVDTRWTKRALFNYLDNATKYTNPGDTITVRAFESDEMINIEVIDTGPGIPVEAQSRLFERFYRAADTEKVRGTGLGLAIVKSVAEAHGGSVYVRSRTDQGSTFGMTLRKRRPEQIIP